MLVRSEQASEVGRAGTSRTGDGPCASRCQKFDFPGREACHEEAGHRSRVGISLSRLESDDLWIPGAAAHEWLRFTPAVWVVERLADANVDALLDEVACAPCRVVEQHDIGMEALIVVH